MCDIERNKKKREKEKYQIIGINTDLFYTFVVGFEDTSDIYNRLYFLHYKINYDLFNRSKEHVCCG